MGPATAATRLEILGDLTVLFLIVTGIILVAEIVAHMARPNRRDPRNKRRPIASLPAPTRDETRDAAGVDRIDPRYRNR